MTLEEVFSAFNRQKVLIIGDVMIDSYLWGNVDRISPEAPVPVVSVKRRDKRLGGAANVAMNIQAMGAVPVLCSVIGEDTEATDFLELLQKRGLPQEGIVQSENRITTVKHRILSGHQHMLRIDSELNTTIDKQEKDDLLERVKKILPTCQVVIFEDYDKGVLDKTLIEVVIKLANHYGIPTVVDPKKRNFLNYKGATLFKPNLKELREGMKEEFEADDQKELTRVVRKLQETLQLNYAFITLSERGAYIDDGQEGHLLSAHIRTIADVSGAGDTVVSIVALCLALQFSPKFMAALANLAGGLVCEYLGVVSINKQDLFEEARRNNLHNLFL